MSQYMLGPNKIRSNSYASGTNDVQRLTYPVPTLRQSMECLQIIEFLQVLKVNVHLIKLSSFTCFTLPDGISFLEPSLFEVA